MACWVLKSYKSVDHLALLDTNSSERRIKQLLCMEQALLPALIAKNG